MGTLDVTNAYGELRFSGALTTGSPGNTTLFSSSLWLSVLVISIVTPVAGQTLTIKDTSSAANVLINALSVATATDAPQISYFGKTGIYIASGLQAVLSGGAPVVNVWAYGSGPVAPIPKAPGGIA